MCSKSDRSAEYGSFNIRELRAHEIMYKNKSTIFSHTLCSSYFNT